MIKVEDLRIGSILQIEDQIITVGKIEENFISWKYNIKDRSFWNPYISLKDERLKPIELSEKILFKCDGIKNRNTNPKSYYLHNRIISIDDNVCYDYATRVKLPYLHTFQNFILALTSKELKINL